MKNLAGDENCDEFIRAELEEAGIEIKEVGFSLNPEVPSRLLGELNGWIFHRAWYYWVAKASDGVVLPMSIAEELHAKCGQDVRVAGHCGAPSPQGWYKEPWHIGVSLYHVDTQEGLNMLAYTIKIAVHKA